MAVYKIIINPEDIQQENCVICQKSLINQNSELIEGDTRACVTDCGHYYHKVCIDTWLNRSETCSLCNKSFGEKRHLQEDNFVLNEFIANEGFNDLGQADDCIICLQSMRNVRFNIQCLNNHNIFHESCARTWLEISHNCPICRQPSRMPIQYFVSNQRQNINHRVIPEPVYQVALNPLLPNRNSFFQNIINNVFSNNLTLQSLKQAINNATTAYLTWRGNGRGFFHFTNVGRNRAINFNLQIQEYNGSVTECWHHICNTIIHYPRHNHSYTSFILNSFRSLRLVSDTTDYTSGEHSVCTERNHLLNIGLSQINIITADQSRRINGFILGTSVGCRLFWRICFHEYQEEILSQLSATGKDIRTVNLQNNDQLRLNLMIGQERFRSITPAFYRGAHLILIVGSRAGYIDFASRIQNNNNVPIVWIQLPE
ncbi:hypothetical protein IB642_07970 [Allofrancisella guangzhouensis]|uniref:RING-type domain-containing protein n=1 Tax=Allofrancisella guangzhouensis TaxID=594679 RepID=A0A0A8E928_9GAMM|nr:RING finger domain-containing protein [Allofrancisella guangzhouensis]AJC48651.1 hypothetical protein SD28_02805 [Allofrancisella guangzhouensis]MBK2027865.1 hypothetical protein [Allofrancisella guangzhouensis]MBK2044939.1 hypothetical protein [Allofrancisella guangzhouensis]MBK2046461.1 hypothetical protein [Allofrancisella guangzhouensis]